ncbi:MAG TPA: hypothetical protein DHV03_00860, partial [Alphaproteobacteria bacterium]|nr:hypothetical protein [Alphaproteobacteria bacterium]
LMGARPLGRVIQEHIKKPLSNLLLFGVLKDGGVLSISVEEDKIKLEGRPHDGRGKGKSRQQKVDA